MKPSSPARAILRTVGGSGLADAIDRARAYVALLVGDFDPSASLADIIAASYRPSTSAPLDLAAVVRAMAGDA